MFLRAAFGSPARRSCRCRTLIIQDIFGASDGGVSDDAVQFGPGWRCAGAGAHVYRRWHHGRPHSAAGAAGSLAARTLSPKAIRAVYDINKTDLQRFRGLESSLRADLPRTISDVTDANVLNGSGFSGSILARTTNPTNPTSERHVRFGGIASLAAAIDGKHARTLRRKCKLVVNPHTLAFMYSLLASNTAVTLPDYYMANSGGVMTTSNMPTHDGAHQQGHRLQDRPWRACTTASPKCGVAASRSFATRCILSPRKQAPHHGERLRRLRRGPAGRLPANRVLHAGSVAMAKSTKRGTRRGCSRVWIDPDSQDPAGFGREDVAAKLARASHPRIINSSSCDHYLHSPDYSRAELARRLRALK